ncbi:hypothetical protein KZX45_13360 [Georgenia sp. EYE_87]|uniref:hypothetical protein n=1 Tax=Georgenia sp. EYE_87 TaxID=2853448 RepID=UPI002006D121|nr:hypothetical protein [Georgenia sp. EYE_87]MCK6211532.1 hypothetical protein [Georgenia sp. EYE_87]
MDGELSTGTVVILVVVVAVVIAVTVVVQGRRESAYRESKRSFSRGGGWRRFPADILADEWAGGPFRPGRDGYAADVNVTEREGLRTFFLKYVYLTTDQIMADGRSTKKEHLVIGVDLPASLPAITLERGARAGIGAAVGGQDISVGHPQIDGAWRITSGDEEYARALVQGAFAHALSVPELRGGNLRLSGATLMWWEKGFDLTEVLGTVQRVEPALVALARAVPAELVRRYGTEPRPLLPAAPVPPAS